MARHLGGIPAPSAEAEALAAWAATSEPKTKRKKSLRATSTNQLLQHLDEVNEMLARGALAEARPEHFVALYADLFFRVYGVQDESLTAKERSVAKLQAKRMLETDFGGDRKAMATFVSWTWTREKQREAWRRANAKEGGRLSWRYQFGKAVLTDYRIDVARRTSSSA